MTAADETLRERVAYAAYANAERLAMALPESLGRRVFDLGALGAFHLASRSRDVVQGNLSRVLGLPRGSDVVRGAAREAFRSYARYWFDTFRIRAMADEDFLPRVRYEGLERLEAAISRGTGAVAALPHLGNWDVAGKWVHLSGLRIAAVAELLRPERLARLFIEHRRQLGLTVVPLDDDRKVADELVRLVGENHVIALVADRDLRRRGVEVEMFGQTRTIPAGPALLALGTGAPLFPCSTYDVEDGWMIYIEEPLEIDRTGKLREDVTALTRALAVRFERAIAAAPTQWHMFQPAWDDPHDAGGDREPSARRPAGRAAEALGSP